ncbi:L-alanine exporter AlaE [Candidatus Peregrinibacteria bacterium]|nr:L-alanine exporter AlaE [Candidatus Peregrinibacteria bacterium]
MVDSLSCTPLSKEGGAGSLVEKDLTKETLMTDPSDNRYARMRAWFMAIVWRRVFADMFARVTFSVATGMLIEMGIAGMSLQQSLFSRASNLPLVILLARPYGAFRDWVVQKCNAPKSERLVRWALVNTVTYTVFFVPQYACVLWLEGATGDQILKASGSIAVFSVLLGAMYGEWLDVCRHRLFGIQKKG